MSPRKLRLWRRLAAFGAVGGLALQAGPCGLTDQEFGALLQTGSELVIRQVANVFTDTIFFLLDNFLVRLTAA